jgi:undecaprenyl-diphosphatase
VSLLEAILLGILQGISEFLPISSDGHLEIGKTVLGVQNADNLLFTIVVHVGTVLSSIVVFRKDIAQIAGSVLRFRNNEHTRYFGLLLASAIPVGIVGVFFKDEVESLFNGNLLIVGVCLLITATLLFMGQRMGRRNNEQPKLWSVLVMGVGQAVAVLPGLSRSGSTIAAGLLCGIQREAAARFSFLMVIMPILGAMLLDAKEVAENPAQALAIGLMPLLVGFGVSFVVGYFACRFMLHYVRKGNLYIFVGYCTVVGLLCMGWALSR